VLQETVDIIPDTRRRLDAATELLKQLEQQLEQLQGSSS